MVPTKSNQDYLTVYNNDKKIKTTVIFLQYIITCVTLVKLHKEPRW